jgi:AGCS family alanine or glycine:cation symporter
MNFIESLESGARWLLGVMEPIANFGPNFNGEQVPLFVILLVGTGIYLTLRLGLIQIRRLGHGVAVTSGKYDDPNEPGDVSHFQALSTALSATVGIGNIAGVAMAIHFGGPGALFWMWVTAFVGMATKYSEVVLAQHYRQVEADSDARKWEGTVSGGPMYYIERGLGPKFKWMAILFAVLLGLTAFLTGNAIQANTLADTVQTQWGISPTVTGVVSALLVGAVILGGITRIGAVTGVLAPLMAAVYVGGGLLVILFHLGDVIPAFALIFREAFNPSAGVAGTGIGAILVTLIWGVRRGLFSNEAGQGSAPIAHAAAKTDEPVSEGVVALLEPFIDTIIICTITGIVIVMTQVWDDKHPTELVITSGDVTWVAEQPDGDIARGVPAPSEFRIEDGLPVIQNPGDPRFGWHSVAVDEFFTDPDQTQRFSGVIYPGRGIAVGDDGREYRALYGNAVETGAPLTMLGFRAGIPGDWGHYVVVFGVLLFAISTAISWSYYGDRCANYLFGAKAVIPYRIMFVIMHFVGAVASLDAIWSLGDVFLAIVVFPNLIALLLLSGKVAELTKSYFERRPWEENARVHAELKKAKAGH